MKIFAKIFFTFIAVPALAETVSVSVPACFIREFEALAGAVAELKEEADKLCSRTTNDRFSAVIDETRVEQSAPCFGFKITGIVECVPIASDQ